MTRTALGNWKEPFRNPGFTLYWTALVATGFAIQIQTVAVGWKVYDTTRDPFDLGLVGLSQFLPALLLVFVTGTVADRFPRRAIMGVCLGIMALVAAGLMILSQSGLTGVAPVFALLAVFGTARAFHSPARQSIVPNLVPPERLKGAIAVNSLAHQIATICGPVTGGLLYALSPMAAFGASLALFAAAAILVARIPKPPQRVAREPATRETLLAGLRYIRSQKVVLGAISLDLFVVLLGGATALLPVFARDVLHLGPAGLGVLHAAPATGAILTGLFLVTRPIERNAGPIMFAAVAAFGLFTLVFSLSTTLWLSATALVLIGASDMISVYVRATLIQLWTPDELRGRVNAVNMVFVGASNELGGFRAGTMAAVTGPVAAVALGGLGAMAVAGIWWRAFPGLTRISTLDKAA